MLGTTTVYLLYTRELPPVYTVEQQSMHSGIHFIPLSFVDLLLLACLFVQLFVCMFSHSFFHHPIQQGSTT